LSSELKGGKTKQKELKVSKLAAAESALKELEKFDHATDDLRTAVHEARARAAKTGDPQDAQDHASEEAAYQVAVKMRREAPHTQRDIDIAAQAVLDAREGK
jgi:hypothetical protein